MLGTITRVHSEKKVALLTAEDGTCTVFELVGDYEVAEGQQVEGDFEAIGGEMFENKENGEFMVVFIKQFNEKPEVATPFFEEICAEKVDDN